MKKTVLLLWSMAILSFGTVHSFEQFKKDLSRAVPGASPSRSTDLLRQLRSKITKRAPQSEIERLFNAYKLSLVKKTREWGVTKSAPQLPQVATGKERAFAQFANALKRKAPYTELAQLLNTIERNKY